MRTVFLYGTEACLNEALEEFKHEMNVMTQRLARQILRTSYAPTNQTIQLDLGWKTMKAKSRSTGKARSEASCYTKKWNNSSGRPTISSGNRHPMDRRSQRKHQRSLRTRYVIEKPLKINTPVCRRRLATVCSTQIMEKTRAKSDEDNRAVQRTEPAKGL